MVAHTSKNIRLSKRDLKEFILFVDHAHRYAGTQRLIWVPYTVERERVGGHSYVLANVIIYLHERYLGHLDLLQMLLKVLVHDSPEYRDGDHPVFGDTLGRYGAKDRTTKEDEERRATGMIVRLWGRKLKRFVNSLLEYQRRESEEARVVYAVDKLLAEVAILLDDGYTDKHLGVTLESKLAYKREKIGEHPLILAIYDGIVEFVLRECPSLLYRQGDPLLPSRVCPSCREAVLQELEAQQQHKALS